MSWIGMKPVERYDVLRENRRAVRKDEGIQ